MTIFCNCGSNNWETVVDRQLMHTKCAVSSEREGLRTLNLVDGRSLDLRKSPYQSFYLEQPSVTNQNTQQHAASRGLSAIAELLVSAEGGPRTIQSLDFSVNRVLMKLFIGNPI